MTVAPENAAARPADAPQVHVVKGLLWREWLAHRFFAVGALSIYFLFGWVLLIFFHPGFILAYALVLLLLMGPAIAGAESIEGSEEFAFSLPPRRSERYLVRVAFWGGAFLLFLIFATLSITYNLPQLAWSLFVQTGFTEPFQKERDTWIVSWLAVLLPFTAFAFTVLFASIANTRGLASASSFLGIVCAGLVTLLGFGAEAIIFDARRNGVPNGYVFVPTLIGFSVAALLAGFFLYLRKEGVSRPAPMEHGRGWVVGLVIAAIVFLLLMLSLFSLRSFKVSEPRIEQQNQMERLQIERGTHGHPQPSAPASGGSPASEGGN